MKDYSVLNGMIENQKSELRTAYDKGYNQGVRDTGFQLAISKRQDEAYKQGLHDAWECCIRFWQSDENTCRDIFNIICWEDFFDLSPSEAIEKFKEYDKKTFDVPDNCKIEVGDEVKRADIDKSLVIIKFTEEGWALGMNEEGNISDVKLSVYKKTGKHFDQIAEVFNSLKGDIDA